MDVLEATGDRGPRRGPGVASLPRVKEEEG